MNRDQWGIPGDESECTDYGNISYIRNAQVDLEVIRSASGETPDPDRPPKYDVLLEYQPDYHDATLIRKAVRDLEAKGLPGCIHVAGLGKIYAWADGSWKLNRKETQS